MDLIAKQRAYFAKGETRSYEHRIASLRKLKEAVQAREGELFAALKADLGKGPEESYLGEVGIIYEEINFAVKNLRSWMKPVRVTTPLAAAIGRSRIHYEPLGVVLIVGPWNYPLQLVLVPLIGALAAGNCAVLKPSELAPHTSKAVAQLVTSAFADEHVAIVEGGVEASQALLAEHFDHIFFTGGAAVGRLVMQAAAQYLTPVTLELGGKSPCIVDHDTDLDVTARRITWGKFFNAGQTCVAPDYLLVHRDVKTPLLGRIKHHTERFFGKDPAVSADYGRIVNERHFHRLAGLMHDGTMVQGGEARAESLYIAPTVLDAPPLDSAVMADEIFGPILPVLEYERLDDAIAHVRSRAKPLALYVFTRDRAKQERVVAETSFGGGCVNDTLVHLSNPHLPFGGVGGSGMGAYHGKYSFETFSHRKSVLTKSFTPDPSLRYPPYAGRMKWLRRLLG